MATEGPGTLPERNVGALLNETADIYGRRFRRMLLIVAILHVPLGILGLAAVNDAAALAITAVVVGGTILSYGAVVHAVGQDYLTQEVKVGLCYRRVWWRVLSLLAIGAILGAFGASILAARNEIMFLAAAVLGIVFGVYWSAAVQAVILEGLKPWAALQRSMRLVRGNWWRIFGLVLLFNVLFLGIMLMVSIPFELIAMAVTPPALEESATAVAEVEPPLAAVLMRLVGSVLAITLSLPIVFISGTLIYFDMRVRKEGYDKATLSQEMNVAAAWRLT